MVTNNLKGILSIDGIYGETGVRRLNVNNTYSTQHVIHFLKKIFELRDSYYPKPEYERTEKHDRFISFNYSPIELVQSTIGLGKSKDFANLLRMYADPEDDLTEIAIRSEVESIDNLFEPGFVEIHRWNLTKRQKVYLLFNTPNIHKKDLQKRIPRSLKLNGAGPEYPFKELLENISRYDYGVFTIEEHSALRFFNGIRRDVSQFNISSVMSFYLGTHYPFPTREILSKSEYFHNVAEVLLSGMEFAYIGPYKKRLRFLDDKMNLISKKPHTKAIALVLPFPVRRKESFTHELKREIVVYQPIPEFTDQGLRDYFSGNKMIMFNGKNDRRIFYEKTT